jgi:ceramide kinase
VLVFLGIIPAGSTDTIAYCLHGTTDIKTCIIHVVLGQTTGLDISSVSNNKGLLKFYASVIAYGFLGDIANENDQYRFLGPKRYEYVGLKKFLLNRGYDMDLHILQEPEDVNYSTDLNCDTKEIKCFENCNVCSEINALVASEEEEKYKRITGRFFMVNCANISCACERSPSGFSPFCHLGDGKIHLILVRHGSMWQNLKLLLKMSSKNGHISQFPFVELYKTRKVFFKALNGTSVASLTDSTQPISTNINKNSSVWNCDGEVLQESDVIVR